MASTEDPKGAPTPNSDSLPENSLPENGLPEKAASEPKVTYSQTTDDAYGYNDDPYSYEGVKNAGALTITTTATPVPVAKPGGGGRKPPPPKPPEPEDEEDGMLRMSFLEHLEELRTRILRIVMAMGVSFFGCMFWGDKLWLFVQQPAAYALTKLGIKPPNLVAIAPMDQFNIIWIKLPLLASLFIASPFIIYQIWGFISPGLYKKERRWAAPFIIITAGLFIMGGAFAYFVAFRFGLEFLLGIGRDVNITPFVSMTEYFDLFVDVILGVALIFEMPVVIFFLTLLRITTPKFLISQSRYAILIITIIAAVVTPTPDVFNMMLFAVPMVMLFYVGIFASWVLTLSREGKRLPWRKILPIAGLVLAAIAGVAYYAMIKYSYHLVGHWPFLTR
jgi:sec-independent protein translocase protein TatC